MDEPASSGDSGDESGSEPESPSEKLLQVHKQEWTCDSNEREAKNRESHNDALASTSSTTQEADSSKPSLPKLMPKIEQMPGGAMLYPGVLAGLDGISSNLGLGNLAMGYPHGFILGLANQGQEGASSSSQPQFITIPLSMAMAAAAGAPTATVTNGCGASASSDDSSELQDLSTGRKLLASVLQIVYSYVSI
uniref:SFRICE_012716 n=1 Tax=Spodoptera frugiperda TaxID=7108 RepID=A0A2H1VQC9_SPOFR